MYVNKKIKTDGKIEKLDYYDFRGFPRVYLISILKTLAFAKNSSSSWDNSGLQLVSARIFFS